jgi:HYR domain
MKKLLLLALMLPVFAQAQFVTFWTEDFGFGCNTGTYADGYFSIGTGVWTVTETGFNADTDNNWFISAAENGMDIGECGEACGNDPTLHLSADGSLLGTDLGAAYFEGLDGFCDLFGCGGTDKRVESPIINCSGMANIVIDFLYIEGGTLIDNATLWYFDGTTWSELADMPKTVTCPNGQGEWSSFSIDLPFSSNNNTQVKIGFRWVNNDDGTAMDPSFAVDKIHLNGDFATDVVPPILTCPEPATIYTEDYCAILPDYILQTIVTDDVDPFPQMTQTPEIGSDITPGIYDILIEAVDNSGNASACVFTVTVIDDDAPVFECPDNITANAVPGVGSAFVSVEIPVVLENCGSFTLINDFNGTNDASGTYPVGSTDVTFTATDESGNVAECIVNVNVIENEVDCCLGDFNCDGVISVADLLMLLMDFGCVGANCATDMDDNDIVGATDLQIFTGLFGTVCP